ncbi:alpha-amylase family glycosyl hydrolase [Brachybacterium sp. GPGPB12]|uniref:alpha-amylase family glycosyl hydrolase n=1 Tax=Brachybacterium sp. GPGPB12 TaxID=3023517 RepID=UPI0031344D68
MGTATMLGTAPLVHAVGPGRPVLTGSLQDELGCGEDWDPACEATALSPTDTTGQWESTFEVPAGQFEVKAAIGGGWDEAYGLDGGEDNIPLAVAAPAEITFRFDAETSRLSVALAEQGGEYTEADDELAAAPYRHPGGGQTFYFVLTDRFENGDPSNDTGGLEGDRLDHGFDATDKGFYQGGDIAGLHSQLDYIEGLGMSAIWLTPSFTNNPVQGEGADASAGYHGYWVTDFTTIDPHLGTNEELKALIEDAHSRGIKVYFDIITNHTADLIDYEEGEYGYVDQATAPYLDQDGNPVDVTALAQSSDFPTFDAQASFPYTPVRSEENQVMVPEALNDVTMYHNRGNSTWEGESVTFGDFDGLDDLMTEDPRVAETMTDIYTTWMDFGIDGFRIDTAKHVDFAFWQTFTSALVDHQAATPAGDQFFTFGEVYDADATPLSPYVRDTEMDSVLDFAYQASATNWAKGYTAQGMAGLFAADDHYTTADSSAADLPTFVGNHDMGRIGNLLSGSDRLDERAAFAHETMLADPRPARHLLRRRAGLRGRRQRQGRPSVDVRQPGAVLPRRHPDRRHPVRERRALLDRDAAVPADQRARDTARRDACAVHGRAGRAVRRGRRRRLRLLPRGPRREDRAPGGAEQRTRGAHRHPHRPHPGRDLRAAVRRPRPGDRRGRRDPRAHDPLARRGGPGGRSARRPGR